MEEDNHKLPVQTLTGTAAACLARERKTFPITSVGRQKTHQNDAHDRMVAISSLVCRSHDVVASLCLGKRQVTASFAGKETV
jgi:hypothetical protein